MKPGLRNGLVLAAALLVAGLPVRAHTPTPEEAEAIAMAAYFYGYSRTIGIRMGRCR